MIVPTQLFDTWNSLVLPHQTQLDILTLERAVKFHALLFLLVRVQHDPNNNRQFHPPEHRVVNFTSVPT